MKEVFKAWRPSSASSRNHISEVLPVAHNGLGGVCVPSSNIEQAPSTWIPGGHGLRPSFEDARELGMLHDNVTHMSLHERQLAATNMPRI